MFNSPSLRNFIRGIKIFLWKHNSSEDCPLCGSPLEKHGMEFHNRRYSCENLDCPFPDDLNLKEQYKRDDWR